LWNVFLSIVVPSFFFVWHFLQMLEVSLYFFDAVASLEDSVHVGAGYRDVDDRAALGADEVVVHSFFDVVSEFGTGDGEDLMILFFLRSLGSCRRWCGRGRGVFS